MGIMKVDTEILKKTVRCQHGFECLVNESSKCLSMVIERNVGGKFLFANCSNNLCHYHMHFGKSVICTCPTRVEIFSKYKK